jgi:hypothetical protein
LARGEVGPEDKEDCDEKIVMTMVMPAKIIGFVKKKTRALGEWMIFFIHPCKYRSNKDEQDDDAKGYIIFETWRMDTRLFLVDVDDMDSQIPNILAVELEAENKIRIMKD